MTALTSKDGKFMCTPEHAVEVAYMISCAESGERNYEGSIAEMENMDAIRDYIRGEKTTDEVIEFISSET